MQVRFENRTQSSSQLKLENKTKSQAFPRLANQSSRILKAQAFFFVVKTSEFSADYLRLFQELLLMAQTKHN